MRTPLVTAITLRMRQNHAFVPVKRPALTFHVIPSVLTNFSCVASEMDCFASVFITIAPRIPAIFSLNVFHRDSPPVACCFLSVD